MKNNLHTIKYSNKYIFFSEEEYLSIIKPLNVNNKNYLKRYRLFKKKYPDLYEFEKNIYINYEGWFPFNGIVKLLVINKRIEIPFEKFLKMSFTNDEIRAFDNEMQDIGRRIDILIDKGIYSGYAYVNSIMREMFNIKYYFNESFKEAIKKIDEYQNVRLRVKKIKELLVSVKHISYLLGYDISGECEAKRKLIDIDTNVIYTDNCFRTLLNEYMEYRLSINKKKTVKTLISHIKSFFRFMYNNYPDIKRISEITNLHINEYKKSQREDISIYGRNISVNTINNRIEALKSFFDFLEEEKKVILNVNINLNYDREKEHKIAEKPIYKEDFIKLLNALNSCNDDRYIQEKMVIIILIDSGRRLYEVCSLQYDCLDYKEKKLYFHELKQKHTGKWQRVGDASINAVLKLQEIAKDVKNEIYYKGDDKVLRRLIPSRKSQFRNVLSSASIRKFFYMLQKKNNIIDDNGNPKFKIHDNKRNFISNMESIGLNADEIARYIGQTVHTLPFYEVRNDYAIEVLKKVEKTKVLLGEDIISEDRSNDIVEKVLNSEKVINRNKLNLLEKINNPKVAMPLVIGECLNYYGEEECGINHLCIAKA